MHRALGVVLWLAIGHAASAALPVVLDDAGNSIRLTAPARRIVSLAPHATELLFAVGAGERVVGVDEYSDYPPAAKLLPRIGRAGALDVERIVALKPDLIIAWGSGNVAGQVAQLKRFGIPVFSSEPQTLDSVATSLQRLGVLSGQVAAGQRAADEFVQGLERLRQRFQHRKVISVFYQIWHEPLMTVGGRHIISDVLRRCGARNIFEELTSLAASVEREAVIRADPQLIVGSGSDGMRPAWLDDWRRWPQLRAVRQRALVDVPPDLMQRPTPRLLQGAVMTCEAVDAVRRLR